ncbi:response regulator [Geobacter sp. SVR]|uniref:response regulator n=1 Tax=Geobacter sp. SVR TaxID=2495594 RepID=UPI00143EF942|nr:response regulator [Geobacter sp. SVR]BCS52702.1 response regulator [Geobacter sp. SVR]GCF86802.1 response regulator [Geobacter sp. SVR]
MKVLIVDDVEINRDLLASFLNGRAAVVSAASGEEALTLVEHDLAAGNPFDLICMDIGLPGISGHTALKAIREMEAGYTGARAKVFMVTASSSPDDMLDALLVGECDDYLTKPLMRQNFLALLDKYGLSA